MHEVTGIYSIHDRAVGVIVHRDDDDVDAVVLDDIGVMHLHQVLMIQMISYASFLQPLIDGDVRGQNLDGDIPGNAVIVGQPNISEAASTQPRLQLVFVETISRVERNVRRHDQSFLPDHAAETASAICSFQ